MEFLAVPLFGCDVEKKTFTFYGKPEKTEPVTAVRECVSLLFPCLFRFWWCWMNADVFGCGSVARYIVSSTLLPKSSTGLREFRVPGGVFTWSEIITTISKASGVQFETFFLPNEDADALAKGAVERGDLNAELGKLNYTSIVILVMDLECKNESEC